MDKKAMTKKLASAALVGLIAVAPLTACETILDAGDAAQEKNSCKGSSGCKGAGSCKGHSSCKGK